MPSIHEVVQWSKDFQIQNPPFGLSINLDPLDGYPFHSWAIGVIQCTVSIIVPHRDSHRPTTIASSEIIYLMRVDTRERLYDYMRSRVHQLVCHELDENILVNGERLFDPHADEIPRFGHP
jgi:hypothetical protein